MSIRSWRTLRRLAARLAVACPFLAVLVFCGLNGCGGPERDEVWVIGLDGADWDLLDPMIERGELPHLAKLREEGAYGRLRSQEPLLSPVIWTSIATGKTADEHGITWFMTDTPTGEKIPVSSRNRWVRAIWNIAHENERASTVIGWWATWPVEPIDGFLVSDYVGWHSFGVTGQEIDAPGKVWPTEMQAEVLGKLPSPDAVDHDLLRTMVDLPTDRLGFDPARGPFGGPLPHLRQAIATARGYTDIALDLLDRRRTDFFAVYYEGTDAAMHLFTNHAPPKQDWVSDEDYAAFHNAISGYWQYQDRLLGELLARRTARTTVIVISDHGFRTGDERLREDQFEIELADASHMIDGVIVMHGPGVQAGGRIRGADIYDVAPTVLHLLGLPVAEDMAGNVIESAFTGEFAREHPVRTVPTYETGAWDRGDDVVVDAAAGQNMEEMLRSLGYISGSDDATGSGGEANSATGGAMTVEHAVNLATVLKRQGRLQEAAKTLEEQLVAHPRHFEARLNLAAILGQMGDLERSLPLFAELRGEAPENLAVIEDYALGLARAGRLEEAVTLYGEGLALDPAWATGLASRGLAHHRLGRTDAGLADLRAAIAMDPRLAMAHFHLGLVLDDRGESAAARQEFERTLQLEPTHQAAALALSQSMQRSGEMDRARGFLEDFVDRAGPSTSVIAELAIIHLNTGAPEQAVALLDDALRDHPDDVELLGNLAVALTVTGDADRARTTLERVIALEPNSAEAHLQLADLLLQGGNVATAERHVEQAARLAPDDTDVQLALGTFYHRSGRLPEAMEIYEAVIAREPDHALAIYQLAMATGANGDEAKAMQLLERARALDPSLPMPQTRAPR